MQDLQDSKNNANSEGTAKSDAPTYLDGETEKTEKIECVNGECATNNVDVNECLDKESANNEYVNVRSDSGCAITEHASDECVDERANSEENSLNFSTEGRTETKVGKQLPERVSMRRSVLICTIVAIAFFFLGIFAANNGWQLLNDSPREYAEGEQAPASEVAMRLYKVAQKLDSNGLYKIDLDSATQGAIEALLNSTGDAHTEYYTPDAYKTYMQYTSGSYSGIGVVIGLCGNYTVVTNVYDDTPAAKAGVKVGDVVVSVDGNKQDWTPSSFTDALKRDDGQNVSVEWLRPTEDSLTELGEAMLADKQANEQSQSSESSATHAKAVVLSGETIQTEMEYGPITIPNIDYELKDSVGYIYLSSFNLESGDAVREAVKQLEAQGAKSLVLDLRNNGGGYVSQASKIVSAFEGEGVMMQIKTTSSTEEQYASGEKITDLPLVVLVNENSASASEIVASALKDDKRATVVGTVTYGKGTVQDLVPLSFGGAIKYTVAEYLSANGDTINEVGVTPDIEVGQFEESSGSGSNISGTTEDAQLKRALQVAKDLE